MSKISGAIHFTAEKVASVPTPFPPGSEQTQIATFLDHETVRIDALVEEQQRLIALLKEKRQAVISHAVTKGLDPNVPMKDSGVEWLGEVPEHWEVLQFRRFTHLSQGLQIPQSERFHAPGNGRVRYITIKLINSGYLQEGSEYIDAPSKRVVCNEEDVLLARTGATGEVITKVSGAFHNNFFKIDYSRSRIDRDFLVYMLCVKELKGHLRMLAGTTTIPDLNHGEFLGVKVPLPPLAEQKRIIHICNSESSKYDSVIAQSLQQVELLQERRSALISAAVTGKIDVRGWKSPTDSVVSTEANQMEVV
ncbi:hypothetical protein FF32_14940 [Halomonas campaniensis]|nr:hypothetical protein FF32_14940 [Halomonas campaniensis]